MRELKFRAWHKERFSGSIGRFEYFDLYKDAGEILDDWFHNDDNFEQYTGLKDKNGKEIYEGDIVKAGGRIYEVAWFEKDGGWFCFRENDSVYTPLYHLKGEVIGNIHENPELVKEEE